MPPSRPRTAASMLRELERLEASFGPGIAGRKLAALAGLYRARLHTAREVERLHEALCFLHAYPDDGRILATVLVLLASFADRADLERHAGALTNSGIEGTTICFPFFWPTARWLARRWPDHLHIAWDEREDEKRDRLEALLPLLAHPAESPGLDELDLGLQGWIDRMKPERETDAAFLIRRFEDLPGDDRLRETLYDGLDIPIRLRPGRGTPARTLARRPIPRAHYLRRPLGGPRPDLAREALRRPRSVRALSVREGRQVIDLARSAMVARSRDLDIFSYGDPRDVRLVDCGEGFEFACIGAIPERRLLLECVYGFLTLRNQVPVGYVLTSALFGSSEIAYNVFDTYRGAEAAQIYARFVAVARHLFGSDQFTIFPFQLGEGNDEALDSGAWWFYYKLGYRPRDPGVRRRVRTELARLRANPRYRSSRATLERLATANLYFRLGPDRDDVIGEVPLPNVGIAVTDFLATHFGSDDRGRERCPAEAAARLGIRSRRGWTPDERRAWRDWAPLVLTLPGVERWSSVEKQALVRVIRAKGGRRESDFARRFDQHRKLRRAIARLARETEV